MLAAHLRDPFHWYGFNLKRWHYNDDNTNWIVFENLSNDSSLHYRNYLLNRYLRRCERNVDPKSTKLHAKHQIMKIWNSAVRRIRMKFWWMGRESYIEESTFHSFILSSKLMLGLEYVNADICRQNGCVAFIRLHIIFTVSVYDTKDRV